MMKYLLLAAFSISFVLSGIAQAQDEHIDPKAYCLQNFPKDNGTGIDAEAYCSCVAKELGGKLNQAKEDDEKGRKKAIANLKPCLDKHAKTPIMNICTTYNDQVKAMRKEQGKQPNLNCNCFYKQLVGNFTKSWTGQGGELSQEEQAAVAQQTLAACLK